MAALGGARANALAHTSALLRAMDYQEISEGLAPVATRMMWRTSGDREGYDARRWNLTRASCPARSSALSPDLGIGRPS